MWVICLLLECETLNFSIYATRFTRAASEAGYSKLDKTISDTFMYGFPEDWQIQISAVLLSLYGDKNEWLVEEVINAASHVFGNKKPGSVSFIFYYQGSYHHV
jgi:hypothetical protein